MRASFDRMNVFSTKTSSVWGQRVAMASPKSSVIARSALLVEARQRVPPKGSGGGRGKGRGPASGGDAAEK